jgi:hypothetical protein
MLGVSDVTVVLDVAEERLPPSFVCMFPIRLAPGKITTVVLVSADSNSWILYPKGVHLTDVHLIGVYLTGV